MKILWMCNLILPAVAEALSLPTIPKEGWVKGLYDAIIAGKKDGTDIPEICFAFPVSSELLKANGVSKEPGVITGCVKGADGEDIEYYGFYEDTSREYLYDPALEGEMQYIFDNAKPDLVHVFGTEFPHTLAAAKVWNNPSKVFVGLQGICRDYADIYTAHLPGVIVTRHTFRDQLKKDSIFEQKKKYDLRADNEEAAMKLIGHVGGRTEFDKNFAAKVNPGAVYHHAGETLRSIFYNDAWNRENSEKYRIFVSQADYPLKGFHYLLMAAGMLLSEREASGEDIPDLQIYVAGQSIVEYKTLKQKIKISSYGKFLRELIDRYGLSDRVHIMGRLSAEEMKEQYLLCDTYVCCSAIENSPNSLGEAMMLQVPIVTAEVGGIGSMFKVGDDGFSYSVDIDDDMEAVAVKLKNSLTERWTTEKNNPGEVDRRRHNAGFHARENHNPEKNVYEMLEIYRNISKQQDK
ncbi:MAG: glycosyltransferase family 4 protein [Lachnospiraceae bacterium]|nr:glycosyltransferase family 4 protein [Lachnospiraceae bacterium]